LAATAINVTIFGACAYFVFTRGFALGWGWTPVELVTTVLTALAVLITVLGIFIAVLAIWRYTRLSEEARRVATEAASETVPKHVGEIAARLVSVEVTRQIETNSSSAAAAVTMPLRLIRKLLSRQAFASPAIVTGQLRSYGAPFVKLASPDCM
jgi:uncharacterized membrane protein YidH (DUF202 family)